MKHLYIVPTSLNRRVVSVDCERGTVERRERERERERLGGGDVLAELWLLEVAKQRRRNLVCM